MQTTEQRTEVLRFAEYKLRTDKSFLGNIRKTLSEERILTEIENQTPLGKRWYSLFHNDFDELPEAEKLIYRTEGIE